MLRCTADVGVGPEPEVLPSTRIELGALRGARIGGRPQWQPRLHDRGRTAVDKSSAGRTVVGRGVVGRKRWTKVLQRARRLH